MKRVEPSKSRLPEVSQADLEQFYTAHFLTPSTYHFAEQYLGLVEEYGCADDAEEDDLGYYDDGVERTLTDEQIAIFRHSEIQALLRTRQSAQEARIRPTNIDTEKAIAVVAEVEDGELEDHSVTSKPPLLNTEPERVLNKKQRKAQKARNKGYLKQIVKPDLRKRTWDKVENGVGSLEYNDDGGRPTSGLGSASQRRRISYDD